MHTKNYINIPLINYILFEWNWTKEKQQQQHAVQMLFGLRNFSEFAMQNDSKEKETKKKQLIHTDTHQCLQNVYQNT